MFTKDELNFIFTSVDNQRPTNTMLGRIKATAMLKLCDLIDQATMPQTVVEEPEDGVDTEDAESES